MMPSLRRIVALSFTSLRGEAFPMIRRVLPALALGFALSLPAITAPATAQEQPFSRQQEDAIRRIVRDYLLKHPDVIAEAIQILQQRQKADADDKRRMMMEMRRAELTGAEGGNPILGNPKGDVTIAEFFDYRCGYCKQVAAHVMKLIETDRNVKVVLIELPILGRIPCSPRAPRSPR
jgi:protein-disulfide isomerase